MLLGLVLKLGALALSILISLSTWTHLFLQWYSPPSTDTNILYDFVVVGGGSGGSTVAGRLARNGFNVLLLEAGSPPPWWATLGTIDIPIFGPLWQRSDLDWAYITEPQKDACRAFDNQASRWPRGKVLGGSGRLNNMVYLRGHEKDWESWGFSSTSQLHYFKKSENHLGIYQNDTYHHNVDGWLPVSDTPKTTPLSKAVLGAAAELGYFVGDLNTMTHTGFMEVQTTTLNGARFAADSGFLYAQKLPNLHVRTNSHVSEVLLDKNNEAKGVKYYHAKQWYSARSRHGVILSAGAIGSPQILLQSGIGPSDHLTELGIPVKVNSSQVGKNLIDHVSTGSDLVLLNASLAINLSSLTNPLSFLEYFSAGKGIFTHGGCDATGLIHTRHSDPKKNPPDIQLLILPAGQTSDEGTLLRYNMGVKDKLWHEYFNQKTDTHVGVTFLVILLHPWSHGEVKLKSRNPFDPPLIDPKYLSDPRDVETLVEGIKAVKKLISTKALTEIGAYLNPKHLPGCEAHEFDSHAYWQCYTRMLSYTVYHPAGTCRIGSPDTGVVDHSFRVHNTRNLYVVDASVMPTLPSANINAAVYSLAERAADVITHLVLKRDQARTQQQTYFSVMNTLQKQQFCSVFINSTRQ